MYRWVEKIQRLQIFRYPNRFLLEFEIPEPGAWWRWLQNQGQGKGLTTKDPGPFTLDGRDVSATNPPITAADISADPASNGFYLTLGGRYATVGLTPPPATQVVASSLKRDSIEDEGTPQDPKEKQPIRFATDATMAVSDGYQATEWSAYIASNSFPFVPSTPGGAVYISVGAGDAGALVIGGVIHQLASGKVGNISRGTVPVSVMTVIERGFAINVNVTCQPTAATFKPDDPTSKKVSKRSRRAVSRYFNWDIGQDDLDPVDDEQSARLRVATVCDP